MTNATSNDATSTGSTVLMGPNCKATELNVCPTVIATMPNHHSPLLTNSISTCHDSSPPDFEWVATRCCTTQPTPRKSAAAPLSTNTMAESLPTRSTRDPPLAFSFTARLVSKPHEVLSGQTM